MEAMDSIEQRTTPSGYGKDVREAILSVPERRDDAQTVIFDKLKWGHDAEVPTRATVPRRVEMASCDLGGVAFFFSTAPSCFQKYTHVTPLRNGPGHFVSVELQNCRA